MTVLLIGALLLAQGKGKAERPAPDVANAAYGPHERNILDLWRAPSETPTPLVLFIHGGGFMAGSKEGVSPGLIATLRKQKISTAAINYRYSQQAPFPACFHDGARALQFLRSRAREWNLDPARVGATGGSAGAGISLWLAFHDDLADPKSADPVARESTRLTCAAVTNGQTSYDPLWIKEKIGGDAWTHRALPQLFGVKPEEFETEKARALFAEGSPITHLTKDDAPVHLFYSAMKEGDIHSGRFGLLLKEKAEPLGLECVVSIKGEPEAAETTEAFLIRHLTKR
jgi:hypothetical protein